jgi:hypothetical protein
MNEKMKKLNKMKLKLQNEQDAPCAILIFEQHTVSKGLPF